MNTILEIDEYFMYLQQTIVIVIVKMTFNFLMTVI